MRYIQFKCAIERELKTQPNGLTWQELSDRLQLPYERPCPTWVKQLEQDIGLKRRKGSGRAFVWVING